MASESSGRARAANVPPAWGCCCTHASGRSYLGILGSRPWRAPRARGPRRWPGRRSSSHFNPPPGRGRGRVTALRSLGPEWRAGAARGRPLGYTTNRPARGFAVIRRSTSRRASLCTSPSRTHRATTRDELDEDGVVDDRGHVLRVRQRAGSADVGLLENLCVKGEERRGSFCAALVRKIPESTPPQRKGASPPAPRICLVNELLDLLLCHGRVAEPRGHVVHRREHEDHLRLRTKAREEPSVREIALLMRTQRAEGDDACLICCVWSMSYSVNEKCSLSWITRTGAAPSSDERASARSTSLADPSARAPAPCPWPTGRCRR